MASITPGQTISAGQVVTRQTLYDLWALGTLGQVASGDIAVGLMPLLSGTGTTVGQLPGTILFDGRDQLWKVFVDMVDNTGCSLWLAFGPDRFEEACVAAEPIPCGAAVRVDSGQGGRWVRRSSGWGDGGIIGFNQDAETTASGAWLPVGVYGMVRAWFRFKPAGSTETGSSTGAPDQTVVAINWAPGAVGLNPGGNMNVGSFVLGWPMQNVSCPTTQSGGNSVQLIIFTGPRWGL